MYKPLHFSLYELVSAKIFTRYGENAWQFLDPRVLVTIDQIREYFGVSCIINDWHWGGKRHYSGFREPACTVGAELSQHRFGRAVDIISSMPAQQIRLKILEKYVLFPHIKVLEDTVDWLHFDVRETGQEKIKVVKP